MEFPKPKSRIPRKCFGPENTGSNPLFTAQVTLKNSHRIADSQNLPLLCSLHARERFDQNHPMADNSATIAKIEAILNTGATSVTTYGSTINYDFAELRRRLNELRNTDPAYRRSRIGQIDLSNSKYELRLIWTLLESVRKPCPPCGIPKCVICGWKNLRSRISVFGQ